MKTKVVTQEDGKIRLSTYEDSLFSETDKAVVILSSKNSGQIEKISWNGLELLKSPIVEKFPSPDLNFQKLKTNISDDGEGLVIISSRQDGLYQLRRSYSIGYDKLKKEHIVEVVYNVKNYADTTMSHRWAQELDLNYSSSELCITRKWDKEALFAKGSNDTPKTIALNLVYQNSPQSLNLTVESVSVEKPTLQHYNAGKLLMLGSAKNGPLKLGSNERLKWKVIYRIKETK